MPADTPPNPRERAGYVLAFEDTFAGDSLDPSKWWPYDLPHWSSRAASAARYTVADAALTLFIAADQKPAKPETDGDLRSSVLQTGQFSGPVGSPVGQHRFAPGLTVREAQETQKLYLPHYGLIEMRAKMDLGRDDLAALWTIGFEDEPGRSGEITICEVFGKGVTADTAELCYGIKPITDPKLKDGDLRTDTLPFDPADFHIYTAEWTPDGVAFFLDNKELGRVSQSPDYPMQLMLGVFALPATQASAGPRHLPTFTVDSVRGYRRAG
ncbi:glycoside hydrolase family 16 protein [Bauldia sp.]|uniref:glycoside hydrolase family 16 protein n=1 Tax=Bauldia sp. TaxID=2575872 RepID=UPI003BAC0DF3